MSDVHTLSLLDLPANKKRRVSPLVCSIAALITLVGAPGVSRGAQAVWADLGSGQNWSDPGNWTSGVPNNGDNLVFGTHLNFGGGNETVTHDLSTLTSVGSITFSTDQFTLNRSGSNALTLSTGITNNSSVNQTINIPLTLSASQTWATGATSNGTILIGGNVDLGANQLTVQGAANLTIGPDSTFSGTGGIAKTGAGTLIVNGTVTASGGLTISSGSLGGNAGGIIATNLAYDSSASSTYSGAITGATTSVTVDMLTTTASSALTLTGNNNSYGGATHVISGFLNIGAANALSGSGVTVESGATLGIQGGVNVSRAIPLTISGEGVVNGVGVPFGALAGGTNQQGDSSYAGKVILGGNARVGSFNSATFTLSGGIDTAGHTLTLGSAAPLGGTFNISGAITGSGNVVIDTEATHFSVANTYTGLTSIINGATLYADVAGALPTATRTSLTLDSTGTGSSTLVLGASQAINSLDGLATSTVTLGANTLTIGSASFSASTFAGTLTDGGEGGSLIKDGVNTLHLSGTNSYTGTTEVRGGILSIDSASALSGSAITVASGGTLNIGTGVNVSTAVPVTISGDGNNSVGALVGSGFSSGASSLNAAITLGADARIASYNPGSVFTLSGTINTAGHALTVGTSGATGLTTINSVISGAGSIVAAKNAELGGVNTYTGSTTIINGATLTASVAGALPTTRTTVLMDQTGSGASTLALGANQAIASLTGAATSAVNLNANTLTVGEANATTDTTFAGIISGAGGSLVKDGASTLALTGTNTYSGGTTINAGRVITENNSALGTGGVTLTGGVLQANGGLSAASLAWSGGRIALTPADNDMVNLTGALLNLGGGTFELDSAGLQKNFLYTLLTFGSTTYANAASFSTVAKNANVQLTGSYILTGNSLIYQITGATATGPTLQNSDPVGIPTFADFIVQGPVTTGGGPNASNTVQTLTFTSGGSLLVNNNLTVTQGPVNLGGGASIGLAGSLTASQLNVLAGGTLHGNGTINGNVVNSGLVSPGNSPGTLAVTGTYTQTSTGTLRIEIAGRKRGQYDLLTVGGRTTLDGTLQLVRLNNFRLEADDHIVFLTAGGGIDGHFASVSNGLATGTILSANVVYSSHEVAVEAVQESFTDVPRLIAEQYGSRYARDLTPNQLSVAQALDHLVKKRGGDGALIEYLNRRLLPELPGDFDRIAPEELTAIYQAAVSYATTQSLNLQRRTDDIRSGSNGFSARGFALNGQTPSYSGSFGLAAGVAGPTGKESKAVETPVAENRWGAFLSGTGEWVDVNGDGNARGFDLTTGGFTLGLDYKVTPNLAIGVSAGYAGTSADLVDNGRVWVNGGKLGLYGTFFTGGGFYTDVAVNGGYNSYDTKRSGLAGTPRGSTDGGELNVLFGTGYDFKLGALTVGPTATFNYTYVGMDGYSEHDSVAPLRFPDQNAESLRTAVGLRASYDWKCGGVVIKPELQASWQHEYADDDYAIEASLPGAGGGNTFNVRGPKIGRDSLLLSGGVAVQLSERVATYLYYDGQLGRENYESHSVSGGVRVAF